MSEPSTPNVISSIVSQEFVGAYPSRKCHLLQMCRPQTTDTDIICSDIHYTKSGTEGGQSGLAGGTVFC